MRPTLSRRINQQAPMIAETSVGEASMRPTLSRRINSWPSARHVTRAGGFNEADAFASDQLFGLIGDKRQAMASMRPTLSRRINPPTS